MVLCPLSGLHREFIQPPLFLYFYLSSHSLNECLYPQLHILISFYFCWELHPLFFLFTVKHFPRLFSLQETNCSNSCFLNLCFSLLVSVTTGLVEISITSSLFITTFSCSVCPLSLMTLFLVLWF
jgi:hypothetical protein